MKNKISELKYHLIHKWMLLNDFKVSPKDDYTFIKEEDQLSISIVEDETEELHSFQINFPEKKGDSTVMMTSYTGDLNLPTLLGYLLWHSLLKDYRIS